MLALVVRHDSRIVDERRFVQPDYHTIDLCIGGQVNVMNGANSGNLLRINSNEQVTRLRLVHVFYFREVLPIVACHDVPEVDAAVFTRGEHAILSLVQFGVRPSPARIHSYQRGHFVVTLPGCRFDRPCVDHDLRACL